MKTNQRKVIKDKTYDNERALYNVKNADICGCTFAGPADGESVLKECRDVSVCDCAFSLRYPLWHADGFKIHKCEMDEKTRAALWYCRNGEICESKLHGIKAVRECTDVNLFNCNILSPEFGWRGKNISLAGCTVTSEYFMFESKNIFLKNVTFDGKYSFQYVKGAKIENCNFSTKDAFWHSKNVTVKDTVLKGEYLGWYSDGLTLINCVISGTQPLCYCKNLTLVNCRMQNCDLAFEYSDVRATIEGDVLSVKNPKSGKIVADGYGEIIFDEAVIKCRGRVIKR